MMRNLVDLDSTLFIIVKYFDAGSHLRCLYTMPTLVAHNFVGISKIVRIRG